MRIRVAFAACVSVAVLVLVGGCSKPLGQATGTVTFKGTPVAGADIAFESTSSPDDTAYSVSSEGGAYTLDYRTRTGLPAGTYKVTITRYTLRNGKPLPGGEEGAAIKGDEGRVVQRSYVFEIELAAGANPRDFELTQGTEARPSEPVVVP
jgi:hypothetical protein